MREGWGWERFASSVNWEVNGVGRGGKQSPGSTL